MFKLLDATCGDEIICGDWYIDDANRVLMKNVIQIINVDLRGHETYREYFGKVPFDGQDLLYFADIADTEIVDLGKADKKSIEILFGENR